MENQWSDEAATGLDGLDLLAYRSRLLGGPEFVNPGGGNTSIKRRITDFQGRQTDVLTIKATGTDLATITSGGFVDLALPPLLDLRERSLLSDEEMVAYLAHCLLDPAAPRPSIETLLHAFLPFRHVDHTHPYLALALATADNGEAMAREAFGKEVAWVPYLRPGFALARAASKAVGEHGPSRFMILQKHGLVVWEDDGRGCYQATLEFLNRTEAFLADRARGRRGFGGIALANPTVSRGAVERGERMAAALLPALRGLLSPGAQVVLQHDAHPEVLDFVNSPSAPALARRGLACPDHVLYTGVKPLFLDIPPEAGRREILEQAGPAIAAYQEDYRRWFEDHSRPGDEARSALPRVALIPGAGLVAAGRDLRSARVARLCYRQAIKTMAGAEALGSFAPLTEPEAFDIEYWPLELYKLTLAAPRGELPGRIALVTGAAGAIGQAICRRFAEEGACVVLSDLNEQRAQVTAEGLCQNFGSGAATAVPTDVTDEASVRRAMEHAALTYGGLDIVVCNAGIAFSHPIEETTLEEWERTMAVLSTGYFLTAREGIALMRRQGLGGSIVFVASKAGIAAARNASAYASAKAATLHLARCLAEEVSGDGIRVNCVAPDAIIQGSGLWAGQWGAARAQAHGIPQDRLAEFYRDRNLLKIGVTAEDVAEAALFFASNRSRATTGAILSVDGGLHDGYVR